MWCRTGDPIRDADDFLRDEERKYRRWLAGCPDCVICGQPITDEECVTLDPRTAICQSCKVDELEKATKTLNPYITEVLQEALDNLVGETPHDEVA